MKSLLRLLAMATFLGSLVIAGESHAAARPPNVIVFLIDDWGWTDGSCFGSDFYETPNMDRLARQGMKFTAAYSACTVCSPTRAAMMTGKYPARLHITDYIPGHKRPFEKLKIPDWSMRLPLEEKTIAEELKARGYTTGLFGKWHLGNEGFWPEQQGFDVNFGGCASGAPRSFFPPYGIPVIKDEKPGQFLSDRLTDEALKFIDASKDKPFYIYFPHYAVHQPIAGKPEVVEKYRQKLATGKKFTHTNAVYAALVESVDDSVGRVMAKLEELKLADNTAIFLTGDNGGLIGTVNAQGWRTGPTRNDPARVGKGSAYEGGVRVPLLVKWPGVVRPASVCLTPVITVDYFPTILEMAGLTPTTKVDGESLLPLLKEKGPLQRTAIYWHYPHYHPGSATPYSAVRDGDWKLIHFFEDNHNELYNLKDDIGETKDLAKTNPKQTALLSAKLQAWQKSVGAQIPTTNPDYDEARRWESERGDGSKTEPKAKAKKGKKE